MFSKKKDVKRRPRPAGSLAQVYIHFLGYLTFYDFRQLDLCNHSFLIYQ